MQQPSFGPVATFTPQHTQGHVLCCLCGVGILPNPANMCGACIRSQVDITEGIQKSVTVLWCKACMRYLQPPKHWLKADLESKELLTYCIKRIRGLSKVKLVDAGFIWTEPHSMRLKVKLTVQAEVFNGAILQQAFVVEFVVENNMCPDCARIAANPNSWVACVQVRQHVEHKRTFFLLEQLVLKHGADAACINVKDIHEGVDFFFGWRGHALKFIDFLQSVVPIRFRHDKQLISHDTKSQTYNYKYTFSVEIVPVCKDDLLCLPPKVAASHGNVGPLVLVSRVTNALTYTDPATARSTVVEAPAFWRAPLRPVLSQKALVPYVVLDIEPLEVPGQALGGGGGAQSRRFVMAEAQVAKLSDFGSNDRTYYARTHLGHLLQPGDSALGYDLSTANLVDDDLQRYVDRGFSLPDVVLVRKSYEEKRKSRGVRRQRTWKLRRMAVDEDDTAAPSSRRNAAAAGGAADMERFLEELEEDAELRARVALFKDHQAIAQLQARAAGPSGLGGPGDSEDEEGEGVPQVPLEELLDDLEALTLGQGAGGGGGSGGDSDGDVDMME